MNTFIVHIFFSGLIAFLPAQNGTEMDIVLLNAGDCAQHSYSSDGAAVPPHNAILFTRAGSCTGQCPTRDADIAKLRYPDTTLAAALDSLEAAVAGGGAWILNGSELSVNKGSANAADLPPLVIQTGVRGTVNGVPLPIPTTASEREDFTWVADLKEICPACTINSDLFAAQPPSGLVAARLRLRSGKLFTYSVARIGGKVTPAHFQRLDGQGSASEYSQAIASWVGADIEVTGDSIEIVEEKFNGDPGRTMHLTPNDDGKIEVAVVNLPTSTPPRTTSNPSPGAGKHFELYYDLTQDAPDRETRLVPFAGAASTVGSYPDVDWQSIHPQSALWSDLLSALRLNIGRGPDDRTLCPPASNYP